MTILEKHKKAINETNYNLTVTKFNGYIQGNEIRDAEHSIIGFTADTIKRCIDLVRRNDFSYARQQNGYINIYVRDNNSPTGVSLAGGIPNELEFLVSTFNKAGVLSPTEDKRTAY
jgi:hypothetical protein